MFDALYNLTEKMYTWGMLLLNAFAEFGYNYFFVPLGQWLSLPQFSIPFFNLNVTSLIGSMTGFQFTFVGGVSLWFGIRIFKFINPFS